MIPYQQLHTMRLHWYDRMVKNDTEQRNVQQSCSRIWGV